MKHVMMYIILVCIHCDKQRIYYREKAHSMSQYLSLSLLNFSHTTWKVVHWTFFSGALDVFAAGLYLCCGTFDLF